MQHDRAAGQRTERSRVVNALRFQRPRPRVHPLRRAQPGGNFAGIAQPAFERENVYRRRPHRVHKRVQPRARLCGAHRKDDRCTAPWATRQQGGVALRPPVPDAVGARLLRGVPSVSAGSVHDEEEGAANHDSQTCPEGR
eukprot:5268579-Prymnesium_polylepis.3